MSQLTPDMFVFLLVPLALQLVALMGIALADRLLIPRQRLIMLLIGLLTLILVSLDFVHSRPVFDPFMIRLRVASSVYGYAVRPLILVLFMEMLGLERGRRVAWSLVVANALVFATAFFCPLAFSIGDGGRFERGPLGFTCHIVSAILFFWLMALCIQRYGKERGRYVAIPILCNVTIIIAELLDSDLFFEKDWLPFLTLVMPTVCLVFYLWLHLRFEREYEQALLTEQRTKIMISQIQPHFLFNTLTTIQAFCKTDPDRAADVVESFSRYLRQNLDSLSEEDLIPFEKEIDHTSAYAYIEMTRFPNVRVTFDTPDVDFDLPSLSVQPIVENAIRHGVRIREQGVVRVTSRREGDFHVVEVSDNGVGFDVSELERLSPSEHIGLGNVKERLRLLCDGKLDVTSVPGEGTTVTMRIPIRWEGRQ